MTDVNNAVLAAEKLLVPGEIAPRVAVNEVPKPQLHHLAAGGDCPVMVLPEGFKVESLQPLVKAYESLLPTPRRRRGTYVASDVPALIKWLEDNTGVDAPVFAAGGETLNGEWRVPKLSLIGIGNYSVSGAVQWHDFIGRYDFPVSNEWKVWAAGHNEGDDGKWFTQVEFAEFIESRIYDVSEQKADDEVPDAVWRFMEASGKKAYATVSELYRISREFKVRSESETEVVLDLSTGEQTLSYNEKHTGKGGRDVKIPNMFFIRIPVFFGQPPVLIGVRLRYRQNSGSVSWSYSLFAPDMIVADEFAKACDAVRKAGRTVYLGSPDVQGAGSNHSTVTLKLDASDLIDVRRGDGRRM